MPDSAAGAGILIVPPGVKRLRLGHRCVQGNLCENKERCNDQRRSEHLLHGGLPNEGYVVVDMVEDSAAAFVPAHIYRHHASINSRYAGSRIVPHIGDSQCMTTRLRRA